MENYNIMQQTGGLLKAKLSLWKNSSNPLQPSELCENVLTLLEKHLIMRIGQQGVDVSESILAFKRENNFFEMSGSKQCSEKFASSLVTAVFDF